MRDVLAIYKSEFCTKNQQMNKTCSILASEMKMELLMHKW